MYLTGQFFSTQQKLLLADKKMTFLSYLLKISKRLQTTSISCNKKSSLSVGRIWFYKHNYICHQEQCTTDFNTGDCLIEVTAWAGLTVPKLTWKKLYTFFHNTVSW